MKYLPLVWAGLWRKPTRTVLTLLSIIVAFWLFGLLQGVNAAFSHGVVGANVDRLYVQSRTSFTEPLPFADLPRIEAAPGVSGVAYATWFGSWYQDPKNFVFSFPVDAERYFAMYPEFKLPAEQLATLTSTRAGAVVGRELARQYGWKIGDQIPLHSDIWTQKGGKSDWTFDIVGIYDVPDDPGRANQFLFNHAYFDEARSFNKGKVGWYIVHLRNPAQAATVGGAIDKLFSNSADETKTVTEKENAQSFLKQIGDINLIVDAIVGAVLFTLLFLTGNTMMQSVRERIPEFAVLKTLGFSDSGVLALVLSESLLICLTAALIGLGLATAMFPAFKDILGVINLPLVVILTGLGIAALLALVSGLPPALRARRLNIVDALAGR
jgi:putative ABC transport system permease protein